MSMRTDHRLLVVEQELGQRPRRFRLADTCRTQEQEGSQRPVRILQPGAGRPNRVGHRFDRLVLTDHALA
jgi:hypothetical protein